MSQKIRVITFTAVVVTSVSDTELRDVLATRAESIQRSLDSAIFGFSKGTILPVSMSCSAKQPRPVLGRIK